MSRRILHLLQKNDNKPRKVGENLYQSGHWELMPEERAATHVALHRGKGKRSWYGGEIVGVRPALASELPQEVVRETRWVVQFRPTAEMKGLHWGGSQDHTMAHRSLEIVE